jgi:hypothetical protein
VKGRTPSDAKAALAPYGDAVVTLWPDWVSTVTTMDSRLEVTVVDGITGGAGGPAGSAAPSRAPARPSASSARSAPAPSAESAAP